MSDKQELIEKLKEAAPKGKISCTDARKIAADFELDPAEVGELCDELEIKIFGCELGCF